MSAMPDITEQINSLKLECTTNTRNDFEKWSQPYSYDTKMHWERIGAAVAEVEKYADFPGLQNISKFISACKQLKRDWTELSRNERLFQLTERQQFQENAARLNQSINKIKKEQKKIMLQTARKLQNVRLRYAYRTGVHLNALSLRL